VIGVAAGPEDAGEEGVDDKVDASLEEEFADGEASDASGDSAVVHATSRAHGSVRAASRRRDLT